MSIDSYSKIEQEFRNMLIKMVINVVLDKTGHLNSSHFSKEIFRLRDNVIYRLSSLTWHVHKLLSNHAYYESQYQEKPKEFSVDYAKHSTFFVFDDLIFNLISLYDYYANLIAYFLIGQGKQTIGWNSLAKSANGKDNKFSSLPIAKEVWKHDHEWVNSIQDFRSKLIHRNIYMGNDINLRVWRRGQKVRRVLRYSIPERLAKKLKLNSFSYEKIGVDLMLGAIEIADRSISWMLGATEKILSDHTENQVQFSQPHTQPQGQPD